MKATIPTVNPEFLRRVEDLQACKLFVRENLHQMKIKLDPKRKPIMSPTLANEIEMALSQYEQLGKWREWGLSELRQQGAAVLLHGAPGCGKTVIARYMSKRIGRGFAPLNMKDVGGKAPGDTERALAAAFDAAKAHNNQTIFLDECEALLWDRSRAGSDSMWMVGVIDELLMQVANYKGLIVFATNRVEILDEALQSRCFAVLQVARPEQPERLLLWRQKMPERYPLKLSAVQFDKLSVPAITGRDIETAIVRESSNALVSKRPPTLAGLLEQANRLTTHI